MPTLAPYGFQLGQSRRSVNEYYVPASDTAGYAIGDVVKTTGNVFAGLLADGRATNGMLHVAKAISGQPVRGVVVGIGVGPGSNDAQSVPTAKTRGYTLLVNDSPQTLWDIQANNSSQLVALAGMYANYTVAGPVGSVSSTRVDASTIGNTVRDLLIVEVLENSGANSTLRVAFVQHELEAAGSSPRREAQVQAAFSPDGYQGPRRAFSSSGNWADAAAISHTRATANASVVDCFGSMQFALSGEARLRGWRRVCNLIRFPENLLNTTYWNNSAPANTTVAASTRKPPAAVGHQRACAYTVTRTSGSAVMLTYTAASYRPGKYIFPVWLIGDGVQTYTLAIGATTQTVTPAAGDWTLCYVVADIANTTAVALTVTNATAGAASFTVCCPMMEWVHGQASPAPGGYVPRDVASYPSALIALGYLNADGGRSAGVDGVRYYPTTTPWAATSGVATYTATPRPLDPSLMLGMQFDPIETNQLFSSRDISDNGANRWTRTGSTVVNATPGDSTLLGKNSIYKMEEVALTSGWRVTQNWQGAVPAANAPSVAMSVAFYAKAAERDIVYIGLRQVDGATINNAFFNLTSGAVTNISAGCTAYMYREGDLWRCCFTGPSGTNASPVAPLIQVGMTTTAGSTAAYAGTLAAGAWFGAVQFEDHGCPTAYIGDTGTASTLSRNADSTSLTLTDCPNIDFTLSWNYTPFHPTDTPWKDSWWYILSAYLNSKNRNAIGLRPNAFGGAGAGMEDEWFFDLYPDREPAASSWDGVEIKDGLATVRAGETVTVQWALAPTGQTSGTSTAAGFGTTNQVARVGNIAAVLTGDTPRPAVNSLPAIPRVYWVGKQGEFLPQRGSFCIGDFSWRAKALTAAEMAVVAP